MVSNGFKACGIFPWSVDSIGLSQSIGKNKVRQGDVSQDILPTTSINFQHFSQLVGKVKLKTLKNCAKNEEFKTRDLSEDALILLKIYKEFFRNTKNLQAKSINDTEHNENDTISDQNTAESSLNYNIENYLVWQKTPERTGKKKTERLAYVIASTAFKNVCEDQKKAKTVKELS
ncbi:hypothetical protein ILUMI_00009 [Ignelater luminosus]|uniref:Uncharacterized protein n=1 Tax=Ignelater luminosus TaxID=2038154 RepID=A0A8K0DMR9_IGNLU|nr:hypothetical protein ILUMI_00009 [Ignelater luminosus]